MKALSALLARRLGRSLTERDVEALTRRVAEAESSESLMDFALDSTPEQLVEWLERG